MISRITLKKINNTSLLESLYKNDIKRIERKQSRYTEIKLKSNKRRIFRNCYEYYINGEALSNIITTKYQLKHNFCHPKNKLKFLEYNTGIIGSFNHLIDKFSKEMLLLNQYSKSTILNSKNFIEFAKSHKWTNERKENVAGSIHASFLNPIKWVYTSVNGDEYAGGWGFEITYKNNIYTWRDTESTLVFNFEKKQYETCFSSISD